MSTALYRRYRPDSFEHVIGQDHVTVPLRAALGANKVTHAYLFSGPRGCGKTTSARILARCLNCAQGPTSTPCGTCDSCRELATGGPGSLDVVEIDAASHGGVDDARELRERATFAPVRDRYKVFIIDEAHMVTQAGFNALLKLVEEPPEHVKFVFATTEPDKVLGTIRSRTHHYPFRLVPPDVLEPYLAHLADGEGVDIAPGVLSLVIRAGGGSVRDTLSVLDQLMAGAVNGHLPYAQAVALLGYTDVALLDESVDALAGGDGAAVYRVVERMVDSGHDPRRFVEDLLQRLRDLLIISVAGDGAVDVLTGVPADQLERMMTQARNWGPRALSHAADLTDKALRSMVGATSPRLQLELLIGRILVPVSAAPAAEAVHGVVGLAGGGAPHERSPRRDSEAGGQAAGAPFGAAQAKERLRAMRSQPGDPVSTEPVSAEHLEQHGAVPEQMEMSSAAHVDAAVAWGVAVAPSPGVPGGDMPMRADTPSAAAPAASVPAPAPVPAPELASTPAPASVDTAPASVNTEPVSVETEPVSGVPASPVPSAVAPVDAAASRVGVGADADMLRQRWPEVIERLSSISRVAWALLNGNGQLGGVDGRQAVVVLPTQGMVDTFNNGQRGPAIEQAIYEATGLRLTVVAQVGQAQGGAAVTTPSASASRREEQAPHGAGPGSASEVAHAASFRDEKPTVATASEPVGMGKPDPSYVPQESIFRDQYAAPSGEVADAGGGSQWSRPAEQGNVEPEVGVAPMVNVAPEVSLEPEVSVEPVVQEKPQGEWAPTVGVNQHSTSVVAPSSIPANEGEEVDPFAGWPAPAPVPGSPTFQTAQAEQAGVQSPDFPGGGSPVGGALTWPDPQPRPSEADGGVAPVVAEPDVMGAQAGHSMWAPESAVPAAPGAEGDMWNSYAPESVTWSHTDGPAETVTYADDENQGQSAARPRLEVISGVPVSDEEHVSAAEDDTASIDDDIDVDMTVGLSAVQEILGAKVIEERVEESGW